MSNDRIRRAYAGFYKRIRGRINKKGNYVPMRNNGGKNAINRDK